MTISRQSIALRSAQASDDGNAFMASPRRAAVRHALTGAVKALALVGLGTTGSAALAHGDVTRHYRDDAVVAPQSPGAAARMKGQRAGETEHRGRKARVRVRIPDHSRSSAPTAISRTSAGQAKPLHRHASGKPVKRRKHAAVTSAGRGKPVAPKHRRNDIPRRMQTTAYERAAAPAFLPMQGPERAWPGAGEAASENTQGGFFEAPAMSDQPGTGRVPADLSATDSHENLHSA
jgi:hypothetical protein